MSTRRRPRPLSPDEQALWQKVTEQVEPVRRRKEPAQPSKEADSVEVLAPTQPDRSAQDKKAGPGAKPLTAPARTPSPDDLAAFVAEGIGARPEKEASPVTRPAQRPSHHLEPRTARRLRRGQLDIDARLDLHGLTQEAAKQALHAFIVAARTRGDRRLLVITGKGRSRSWMERFSGDEPWWKQSESGVLRKAVPRWLDQAPFNTHIAAYQHAGPRHGGDGALYVQLRRPPAER